MYKTNARLVFARCLHACSSAARAQKYKSRQPARWTMPPGRRYAVTLPALVVVLLVAGSSSAAPLTPEAGAFEFFRQPAALVLVVGLATLLPFAFMALTAFVKISTVLQIVKGAIGVQSVPSNSIIVALAAALTLLAMGPVGTRIVDRATPLFVNSAAQDSVKLVGG